MRTRLRELRELLDAHPFEILSALVAVAIGLTTVLGYQVSPAVNGLLTNDWVQRGWGAYLLAGGVCVLVGILGRSPVKLDRGFEVERVGLGLLALGLLSYGLCLVVFNEVQGLPLGSFLIATAGACQRRACFLKEQQAKLQVFRMTVSAPITHGGHEVQEGRSV